MSKQKVFTDAYIDFLYKKAAEGEIANYFAESFPIDEEMEDGTPTIIESHLEHDDELLEKLMNASSQEAPIILYKAFEKLTPAEAAQKNLWIYLEHVDLFPLVQKITQRATTQGAILDNWFGTAGYKHALASLWWQVYLTVDTEASDEEGRFKLTKYFLSKNHSDLILLMSQSTLFKCRAFSKGVLTFLMENDSQLKLIPVGRFIIPYYNKKGGQVQLASWDWTDFYNELNSMRSYLLQLK